jgi:hypothetical protein
MFNQQDADDALNAVATYTNFGPEHFEVVLGDVQRELIYVATATSSNSHMGKAYIYSLETKEVFQVDANYAPEDIMPTIYGRIHSERRSHTTVT